MCPKCNQPVDDHSADGCPAVVQDRGTVVLWLCNSAGKAFAVEMPGATTVRYAAKRVAETLHLDGDALEYGLMDVQTEKLLDSGEIIAPYDGRIMRLGIPRE